MAVVQKVRLDPFQRRPAADTDATLEAVQEHIQQIDLRLGAGPLLLQGYSVNSLPDANEWGSSNEFSSLIYIHDETGGATLAFSDGTNWRRVQDRAIVS